MRMRNITLTVMLIAAAAASAQAAVYRVGSGRKHATISEVAADLEPGDVVEVTGDITDTVDLTVHGRHDAPITIRGVTRIEDGRIIRAKMTRSRSNYIMSVPGNWIIIEGIDFDGQPGREDSPRAAMYIGGSNVTLRNCRFCGFYYRALVTSPQGGNLTIEFCEFDSTAYVDIWSWTPGAVATVQFCWFHDMIREGALKLHGPRNVVRCNWFENLTHSAVKVTDRIGASPPEFDERPEGLYPMHTDIVGNVFFMGSSPGSKYSILSLGGADATEPGTEGDFHIAHNLFVQTRTDTAVPGRHILVHGNVDRVLAYNNVFMETTAFRERRGHGEPIVEGANNWVSARTVGIPEGFVNTLRGINPHFVDLVNFDLRPAKDSPLAGAGLWPLPRGRIVELAPEFEPQRGIPADLKPVPRRKATPPSIGPFEAAE